MAIITLENLKVGYNGQPITDNINISINSGDFLCILGDNGSGKSTLMKTILGLMAPISGKIILGDGLTHTAIGYMPQISSHQRDFPASVNEVVLSGCIASTGIIPFYKKADKQRAADAMKKMGVYDLRSHSFCKLSGGQQQRVLVARALCATQKLIVLDEPAAGLDDKAQADMYSLISALNRDGISVIMVLHDVVAAKKYASHILHIGDTVEYSCNKGGGTNE